MRYATFSTATDSTPRLGIVSGDRVTDAARLGVPNTSTLLELIRQGPDTWRRLADAAGGSSAQNAASHAASEVRWHAPIPRPDKNVFCVGRNYAEHVAEGARWRGDTVVKLPEHVIFFSKTPATVNGPFDEVAFDMSVTTQVDWEAELGVVIGRGGKNIRREDALAHVFGYTVVNDVSARDVQKNHHQFFKGKSLDGFCPMGPLVVTADEFGDPQNKLVSCRVNGVVKQQQKTSMMIFPVDVIIESLSRGLTIEPGDIIATGTPEGAGFGRVPPEYLEDGDVLETEVEGIGVLRNRIRATQE
jgi:2-keto-4-pentenoate hydratase/2-oxohepta-3-ene-1,7-dioic acid hydratase in catechol pathway